MVKARGAFKDGLKMSVFPDCQGKKLIEKPPRVFANFGRLAVHDHAQGFLNKLKQKNTPSNQLRRSATY